MGMKSKVPAVVASGIVVLAGQVFAGLPGVEQSATAQPATQSIPAQTAVVQPVKSSYVRVLPPDPVFNFSGDLRNIRLNDPIVGAAPTQDQNGYWLVASDGGIFSFGSAAFYGSTGSVHLSRPIVGMAATPDGRGYWLVASDGGVFSFGDARFYGSTGSVHLSQPIVGMAATADGQGYWMVSSDGGVFSFGDATFYGSAGSSGFRATGMATTPDGKGYWITSGSGTVRAFGDAPSGTSGIANAVAVVPVSGGFITVNSSGQVQICSTSAPTSTAAPTIPVPPTATTPTGPGTSATYTAPAPDSPLYTWDFPTATFWAAGKTIDWYVSAGAPTYGLAEAQTAINQVAAATGLAFHYAGVSSFQPFVDSYTTMPAGIVIGWEAQSTLVAAMNAAGTPDPAVIGLTQPLGEGISASKMNIFKAEVAIDNKLTMPPGFGPGDVEGNVLLHEMGHAMGLGHVPSTSEIMNPYISSQTPDGYAPGDLAGLKLAGESPAF